MALLWLWRQDRGHTWPYMARHDQCLLVILKLQFLVALDLLPSMTFFWNDRILSHNDHKKGIWSFPVQTYVLLYKYAIVSYIYFLSLTVGPRNVVSPCGQVGILASQPLNHQN